MNHDEGIKAAIKAGRDLPGMACFVNSKQREEAWVNATIQAYLSATDMAIVPVEPTESMCKNAFIDADHTLEGMGDDFPSGVESCRNIYIAMLASFPTPFSRKGEIS